jgi:hypothetical protein
MLFELRFYEIVQGRVADELALVHAVACAPIPGTGVGTDRPSLWDKAGISLRGIWLVTTGHRLPRLCYLLAWNSVADRERGFPSFWADPDWRALKAKSPGLLVERIEDWLLSPNNAWLATLDDPRDQELGAIHELAILRSMDGRDTEAERTLSRSILPHIRANRGRVLGAFEICVGARLPATVLFLAWSSFEARQMAWERMNGGERTTEAPPRGAATISDVGPFVGMEQYLMEPVSFAVPRPNLGLTPQPAQNRRS